MARYTALTCLITLLIIAVAECVPTDLELKNIDMARDRRPIRTMRPAIPSSHHKIQKRTETNCNPDYEFQCDNGDCIDAGYKCDIYQDCEDASDETGCPCLEGEYHCGPNDVCLFSENVCNGVVQCLNGADEEECSSDVPVCADGSATLTDNEVCNYRCDCLDCSDEKDYQCDPLKEPFPISSPNYPESYPPNLVEKWIFSAEEGHRLTFDCSVLDVKGNDNLTIGNGMKHGIDKISQLRGESCKTVTSNGTTMWVMFTSDFKVAGKGFRGTIRVADLCGYNNEVITKRIVGGQDTTIERWPWQIMLRVKGNFICGGTLISQTHVLTAAHCIDESMSVDDYHVDLGKNFTKRRQSDITRSVIDISTHENYDGFTLENDIAILTLDLAVSVPTKRYELEDGSQVNTACIDDGEREWDEESKCFITGFGSTYVDTQIYPHKLQEANIVYLDREACLLKTSYNEFDIWPKMICGNSTKGEVIKDSSQGDSGGPLVCRHGLRYYVVGITSWGYESKEGVYPGVYTSVKDYSDWIKTHL